MSYTQKARDLGIDLPENQEAGYLNLCIRTGNLLITSGHVSDQKGIVGDSVSTDEAYAAAKDCAVKILQSVYAEHGTLDDLKVIKLLGCVYSKPEYTDQHLVINGASDLYHEIFGKSSDGYHARSALGFAALPTGASVEIEAIFEIKS
ncbi:MAG: RidA family protein [Verrucomicrobiales bacterium]|nr:RidA family protein [Verrucomicrobiales bacterium]